MKEMGAWAAIQTECRRVGVARHMDGKSATCAPLKNVQLCEVSKHADDVDPPPVAAVEPVLDAGRYMDHRREGA